MSSSAPAPPPTAPWLGVALVLASSIAFSVKAVLAKLMYHHGITPVAVLTLRMGLALPVYLISIWRTRRAVGALSARDYGAIALLGALLYYASIISDFWGLRFISAGLERLVLFSYPTLVVLMSAAVLRERIRGRQLLALVLTYLGIALSFHAEIPREGFWLGGGLVLLSALTYAAYLVGSTRYIRRFGSERVTSVALSAAALATLAHFAIQRPPLLGFPARVYGLGLAMALFATVLPTYALAAGIRRIGPGASAILGTLGPVSTLLLAYWLLAEPITLLQIIGTAIVLLGATLIASGVR
jgi:drug/metabolite transporter (DMT)-like permease